MAWRADRLIDEIDLLGSRGLAREEFFAELSPRLRNVIDNDASCWHTLDPSTGLLTSDAPKELIERGVFAPDETPAAGELIVRSESMVDDVNTFAGLAARRVPVGILERVTRGDPRRARATATCSCRPTSPTSCAAPSSSAGACGAPCTLPAAPAAAHSSSATRTRSPPSPGRSPAASTPCLCFDAARRITGVEAPGIIVLGPHDEVELITPPARELLASLYPGESGYTDETIATPVLALASFVG